MQRLPLEIEQVGQLVVTAIRIFNPLCQLALSVLDHLLLAADLLDVLLDSVTVPAYVLGANAALRIQAAYSFAGSSGANKAPQIKAYYGVGNYGQTFTSLLDTRGQFSTHKSVLMLVTLQNLNSLSVNQIRPNDYAYGASGNAFASSAKSSGHSPSPATPAARAGPTGATRSNASRANPRAIATRPTAARFLLDLAPRCNLYALEKVRSW